MILTEKDNIIAECARCEKKILPTQLYASDGGVNGYCLDCFLGVGLGSCILSHTYKPIPVFCHMSTEKESGKRKLLYLGIELEIEHRAKDLAKSSYSLQSKYPLYVKHDGSLEHGLELVSYPQTAKYHQKVFNWYKLLKELREGKWTSYNNKRCGLHIHVNKTFFNEKDDILKIVLFFHKCFDKIKVFAKRHNVEYCKRWEQSLINDVKQYKGGTPLGSANNDRYTCINLQNTNTVEFRIYRGTLNYERFLASILFTDAVCNFVKGYSIVFFVNEKHKSNLLWEKFIDFIGKNDRYDFLKKYFKNHTLDNKQISKVVLSSHEDYDGVKMKKVQLATISNLKTICKLCEVGKYLFGGMEYEYVESELPEINLRDSLNYYIYNSGGNVDFLMPKHIARVKLNKNKLTFGQMAKIIYMYFTQGDGYILRIMNSNGDLYNECEHIRALFTIMGDFYEFRPHDWANMERQIQNFLSKMPFEYEIIREDVAGCV